MEEKEVEVQIFDGKEYFLYDKTITENGEYTIFSAIENPEDIIVAKEKKVDNEIVYEIIIEEEKDEVLQNYQTEKND